jgi:hypothetical protein
LSNSTDAFAGLEGIMHGVAYKVRFLEDGSHRRTLVYDERYRSTRKSPKVIGHNDIAPGTWYPYQLVACFRGAHGHHQAGIFGTKASGAYSIIVTGKYESLGLDEDKGEYLYYSDSERNDNPKKPVDSGPQALALHTSLKNGNPVRVLRASTGKSNYAPRLGIRYDGLYRVVALSNPKNAKGGLYEQFHLERLGGQGAFDIRRPDAREMSDAKRIADGYPGLG